MSNLSTPFSFRVLFLILMISTTLVGSADFAQGQQDRTPARGFSPNGSYALTDLETINTANGDMMLRIPLASLPPARGGLSAKLFLIYNSKLWDSHAYFQYDPVPPHDNSYTRNVVEPSAEGGWRYGYRYQLQLFNRYDYDSSALENGCSNGYPSSENFVYHWKLKMSFPDGAVREFRPAGFGESTVLNDGYFSVEPNGMVTACSGNYYVSTSGMTYYSTDGTYMRLFIAHDGDTYYGNNAWTLYMPDGTRVTGGGATNQRVYDRNENYIEIGSVIINGQAAYGIADQLGRGIAIGGANGEDDISVSGVGGTPVHTTVKWKQIWVQQRYRAIYDPVPLGTDIYGYLNASMSAVERITLPAQAGSLHYDFTYNASDTQPAPATYPDGLGELHSIMLPTGAQATYTFLTQAPDFQVFIDNYPTQKTLTYRQEYDGVTVSNDPCIGNDPNCITETWAYSIAAGDGIVTAPDGGQTRDYSVGGLSYQTIKSDGTVIERNWQNNRPSSIAGQNPNPYVKTEFVSIPNAAGTLVKTAIKDFNYDRNGNVTRVAEYDWVPYSSVHNSGSPVWSLAGLTPARVTTTSYYNGTPDALDTTTPNDPDSYYNATAPRLLQLVASSEVSNGSQTLARSEFYYDNTLTTGNLTQQKSWDSTKGGYSNPLSTGNSVSVSTQYNQYGSPILTTDARGNQTQLVYGAVGGVIDLYPTEVRTAYQTAVQRTETRQYDFSTGVVTNVTDTDNGVSTATTYDLFGRPTLVKSAEGKPEEARTSLDYSDTARRVITRSDMSALGDGKLVSIQHYDQMGRVRLSRQLEDSATQDPNDETQGIKVQTRYKYSGANSYQVSSHPYREAFSAQAPAAVTGWSRTKADSGGRLIEVQSFGGNTLPEPWSSNTVGTGQAVTSFDANSATVTDQAGKRRRSVTDGLGRLIRVDEPDTNGNLDVNGVPVQWTSYSYDTLDNLTSVSQGAQTRTFAYDSLKRLTLATNPESGTINYQYDSNGNLAIKTDARGVSAHYAYDALNRVTRRWYNGSDSSANTVNNSPALPSGVAPSDEVNFYYDAASLPGGAPAAFERGYATGRLVAVTYGGASAGTYRGYDALGRVVRQIQQTDSVNYLVEASYNPAGAMTGETYPSVPGSSDRRSVNLSYDAAGRLSSLNSNPTSYAPGAATSGITYAAHGAVASELYGNNLTHTISYNNRLQVREIKLGQGGSRTPPPAPFRLTYNYGTTDNNGNVQSVAYSDDQFGFSYSQSFTYDSLNRLATATETASGSSSWSQTNVYDRYGNRGIDLGGGNQSLSFNPSNNRITSSGYSYDAAGNLLNDGAHAYTFDAENKIKTVDGITAYVYDGEGQRVRKLVGENTRFIYGLGGQELAEFSGSSGALRKEYLYGVSGLLATIEPTALNANGTRYLTADHLGTPRVITNAGTTLGYGNVVSRHDYKPFGEELAAGVGGRTTQEGYDSNDGTRQKFTQKERDIETGLDYFLARYYSSTQGRFTSPDEFTGGPDELYYFVEDASANPTFYADLRNPQSLNKYQYSYNNPLRWVDPDGHDPDLDPQDPKCQCVTPAHVQQAWEDLNRGLDKVADTVRQAGKVVLIWELTNIIETIVGPFPPANTAQPTTAQPTTGTPPSTGREPVAPPPIQSKNDSVRKAQRNSGGVTPGKSVTDKQAAERLKGGGDTISPSRAKAKQVAKNAAPDGRVVHDRAHRPGYRPHYHDKKRKNGHSFYD